MAKAKLTVALVILALFLVVVVQNAGVVTVRAFLWEMTMSQIILLVVPLVIGFALGFIVAKIGSAAKRLHKT
jgi:uncharacterized integral membrane protein